MLLKNACLMNGKEKILDQLKNNHQQCQNLVLARGWHLCQRSGEIELKKMVRTVDDREAERKCADEWNVRTEQVAGTQT